ncbi:MAG: hypothetical protein KOO61_05185 [Spirochaetales bacterium]|nr:hypothetical protein [Spirochaetales bacterium]
MKKISILDRILLLIVGVLAAYKIVVGIEGFGTLTIVCYTIAFGVLMFAAFLFIIFGFDILDSKLVVIVAAAIPLILSLALIAEYLPSIRTVYMALAAVGLVALAITRYAAPDTVATVVLATVHGIAGLLIFSLPIIFAVQGKTPPGFALVGVGGGVMGIGGLSLVFLKLGKPILSRETIFTVLPGILLFMTVAFVAGLAMR